MHTIDVDLPHKHFDRVVRVLGSKSKRLKFDDQSWSCVEVSGNFCLLFSLYHTISVHPAKRHTRSTDLLTLIPPTYFIA